MKMRNVTALLLAAVMMASAAACAAAGVSGAVVGLLGVHAYSMGSFNLFTLSFTIGGDSMTNFYMACGCAALAFVLGFVFTWLIGFKEEEWKDLLR